jgi:hypothetical protein
MDAIQAALKKDRLVDISTIGRRSGEVHRIEIAFHLVDDQIYLTGRPRRRDWLANMKTHPQFTFHLKQSAQLDIPALAIPIADEAERRAILTKILAEMEESQGDLESWVAGSPLVRVELLPVENTQE